MLRATVGTERDSDLDFEGFFEAEKVPQIGTAMMDPANCMNRCARTTRRFVLLVAVSCVSLLAPTASSLCIVERGVRTS
jgi:hypothetical protein